MLIITLILLFLNILCVVKNLDKGSSKMAALNAFAAGALFATALHI